MKQTVMWLALALLFAIGATLSITADSFGPTATAETTEPTATAETTAPATFVEAPQPVVAASAKPAAPEVPVVILDDVPPKSAVSPEALARWFVAPGTPPAAEALLTPSPLAPATTIAGRPGQDPKAGIKPLEGDARPTKQPKGSSAELPGKHLKRTANARGCGSAPSRFADLLQRLKLAPRCTTRRSAA